MDCGRSDAVGVSNLPEQLAGGAAAANVFHSVCREFRAGTRPSSRGAAFLQTVLRIVGLCADEQMCGVTAGAIIAAMQDTQPLRNRPEGDEISGSICRRALFPMELSATVRSGATLPLPVPAVIRPTPIDARPEAIRDRRTAQSAIVPVDEAQGVPFDLLAAFARLCRDRRAFTAPALTLASIIHIIKVYHMRQVVLQ